MTAAWNDAQQGIKLAPENPQLAMLAAETAIAQGTPQQAKDLVSRALAANPALPELYVASTRLKWRLGICRGPSNGSSRACVSFRTIWICCGALRSWNWRPETTKPLKGCWNSCAAKYYPAPIRLLEARLLIADGKAHEAADLLEKSRALFNRAKELLKQADYQLAICYQMMGNPDQELAALRRALGLDPLWMPPEKPWPGHC